MSHSHNMYTFNLNVLIITSS